MAALMVPLISSSGTQMISSSGTPMASSGTPMVSSGTPMASCGTPMVYPRAHHLGGSLSRRIPTGKHSLLSKGCSLPSQPLIRVPSNQKPPPQHLPHLRLARGTVSIRAEAAQLTTASEDPAPAASEALPPGDSGLAEIYGAQRTWTWKGHKVNYSVLGSSRGEGEGSSAVVLIHGFGASIGHWRKTMPLLAKDGLCRVYALDLLGLGASEKPADFPYSIEAWSEMVGDFAAQVVEETQVVFMGNSIGSLIALAAAAGGASEHAVLAGRVKGVVLLNCAGGLNNKAILDDWRIKLALPIFYFIDFLLGIPSVARSIFNEVKTEQNVRAALSSVYCNQAAVDDELVQLILRPADDEGALGVFIAVLTGPPGPRPEVLIPQIDCPILILWGDNDPFTPMDGPIGKYFKGLPASREGTSFVTLRDVGHCPQDDRGELVHDALLPWLVALFAHK